MKTLLTTNGTTTCSNAQIFDIEAFAKFAQSCESNRRAVASFISDVYNYIFWDQVEVEQKERAEDPDYMTRFIEKNIDDVLESPFYVASKKNFFGARATKLILALNSRAKETGFNRFVNMKVNFSEDNKYSLKDVKTLIDSFEMQTNDILRSEMCNPLNATNLF